MSRKAVFLRWFSLFLIISWLAISLPPSPAGASRPSPTRVIASQREVGRAVHPGTPADIQSAFSLSWTATGENADDAFGFSVATAGDVNGDGYADLLVGAFAFPAGNERGKVYLYLGSADGFASTPAWTATGENVGDRFGYSIATAGDVNGDGYDDVLVGAYGFPNWTQRGKVYLYLGSPSGLSSTPDWTATGENTGDLFGLPAVAAGDVNGDGYGDVLIGASHYPSGDIRGKAYLYLGSSSGLSSSPAWTATGENSDDTFSFSMSTAGDVNGDGYADVLIGGYTYPAGAERGKVYLYLGSPSGLPPTPDWTETGENASEWFGVSVTTAGDVNGDGYSDILIGAPAYPNGLWQGKVYLHLGSSSGLSPAPDWTIVGENAGDALGRVSLAGDVNGDGYADVLIGAPHYPGGTYRGKTYLYLGSSSGLSSTPDWTTLGENDGDTYGGAVSLAGDVNGDGYTDIVVGAPDFPGGNRQGKVYLYLGASMGPSLVPDWTATGESGADDFGFSVASAGDVNGDGHGDILIGAVGWATGQGQVRLYLGAMPGLSPTLVLTATGEGAGEAFGRSIATAGDVNGDGYADFLIGAPDFPGGAGRGKVYLYLGTSSGLSLTLAWMAVGEYIGDRFGSTVSTAGDVNGDGYADILIGARGYPAGSEQGKVYLYWGSPSGPLPTAAWTATGEYPDDLFGSAIASAGDVNGDGYADVLIGAPGFPFGLFRGRGYLYWGSSSGLSSGPAWMATGENNGDSFAFAMSLAGDVNGDGYGDVLIGAPDFPTGAGRGKVYLYWGASPGPSFVPDWTATGENGADRFGSSVAMAGDVSGDGYADLLVGAAGFPSGNEQGKAYLYTGSSSGPGPAPDWEVTGENAGDTLGWAVAGAGDVNGDGYADLLVGVPGFPAGDGPGMAGLYYGNKGGGRLVLARPSRGDGSGIPVQPWGLAHAPDGFVVHAWATDPLGRGRVKLQLQVCPSGQPFTATACITHTATTWTDVTTATSGVLLTETVTGLTPYNLYRWRVRVLYAPQHVLEPGIIPPPHPVHGPWRRSLAQTLEADLRTSCTYSMTLTPTVDARFGHPRDPVTYTLWLTHTGDCTDTFTLTVEAVWPVEAPSTIGLGPGESTAVVITVTIPAGTPDGASDVATLTFTSQGNPAITTSSVLTTTAVVEEWRIYLPILMRNDNP